MESVFYGILVLLVLWAVPAFTVIKEWERVPVLFLGRYWYTSGPGPTFIDWVLCKKLPRVSVKDIVVPIEAEGQTQDKVGLLLDLMLTRKVVDVRDYSVEVTDAEGALEDRARTAVLEALGHSTLEEVQERTKFSKTIRDALAEKVKVWGFEVIAFEIDDLKIGDPDIAASISAKARATANAAASVTLAQAEVTIATCLNEAAALLTDRALMLRQLQGLREMANSASNNTVIIPSSIAEILSPAAVAAFRGSATPPAVTA